MYKAQGETLIPVMFNDNLKVISIGFLLGGHQDSPLIWRGPLKTNTIKQFLKDVAWGELDYLIIDSPPGTGDKPLSICQLIEDSDGAIIITTPQEVALADVRKSINFCRKLNIKILGVIENMSGFISPNCKKITEIFKSGGGEKMAKEMKVPFLGRIPLDPDVVESGDNGSPLVLSNPAGETAQAFKRAVQPLIELSNKDAGLYIL